MVLIRSAFWLIVAFAVVGPQIGAGPSVDDMAHDGVEAGRQFVGLQLDRVECASIECITGKAVAGAGLEMLPARAVQVTEEKGSVPADDTIHIPFPTPRPAWMG